MGNTINHKTLGDIQKHEYLTGVIVSVYPESNNYSEEIWDTADVFIEEINLTWYNAPIFYHCLPTVDKRPNGALFDAARGFSVNDRVVLLCKGQTAQTGKQLVSEVTVISHEDGVKKCSYNYIIVRAGLEPIKPIDSDESSDLVIVYDVAEKKPAVIIDTETGNPLNYPCSISKLKSFFSYAETKGVDMFEAVPQGDNNIQVAGASPNWKDDHKGEHIRGGDSEEDWWNTYDYYGNPVINLFESLSFGIMLDNEGASDGSFRKTMDILEENKENIQSWDNRSNSFRSDYREYEVSGSNIYGYPNHAIGVKGFPLQPATSRHYQVAYGENEVWVCGVNSYNGMIVSYCDEKWKFARHESIPPAIPIPGVVENWTKLSDAAAMSQGLPGGMAGGQTLESIGTALASEITLLGKGNENSIFSVGALKRINEGAFHRTIHPAIQGSFLLATTGIPEDTRKEPLYYGALNLRWDKIETWYRYDNWQNTLDLAFGTFGVNVPWWFVSTSTQWGAEAIYFDTPLGSMWLQSPSWKAALWSMQSLSVSTMTARRDEPINQRKYSLCKHSRGVACQLYMVQRTSVTLWAEKEDIFVKQELGKGTYHSIPKEEDGSDPVSYIKMPDGSRLHYEEATPEQIEEVLSEMEIYWSESEAKNEAFRLNRNDFEIMGAADLYGELMLKHDRRSPLDQERTPEFEKMVADLIKEVMKSAETKYQEVFLDMEIV